MKTLRTLARATATALLLGASSMVSAQTLNFAYDADPVSMDPHEQLSGGTLQLSHMVFDPLVRWNSDYDFDPRLATSWERVDDTIMRFTLREGVKFHSGNPMTADDVVWTIERLKTSPDFKAIFANWKTATAIDDTTVEIKTKGPSPLLLNIATYVFPMDKKFYEEGGPEITKHGDSFASKNISGTGPFIVTEREQGVKMVFKRNPDYWDTDSPGNVQTAILTPIKEAPTRVAALLSGDVDFIAPVPPTDLDRIRSLFDDLERKRDIARFLELAEEAPGVRIFIGSENELFSLSGSSLVVSPYMNADRKIVGAVGVIGPTRLNYGRIVPIVDYTAQLVGKALSDRKG